MKNTLCTILLLSLGAAAFSGCIKETFPQGGTATSEQVGAEASALEASISGIPAMMTASYPVYGSSSQYEYDMAYPSFMMQFTELMGDVFPLGTSGYDWFRRWNTNQSMGESYVLQYIPWRQLYSMVKGANDIIGAVNAENATAAQLGYLGMAYAYRAFDYYHLMNMYEPVENEYTDVSAVKGLTVPIVTDETLESEGKNNPRATHDEMVAFILSDLDKAEQYLTGYTPESGQYPDLAVVYGLKAKVYMSDGQYANAETYARKAIDESGATPMTESQWLDVNTGFNTANSAWMWYVSYSAENMSNLCNWIGWISPENDWGYAGYTIPGINRWIYDRIPESDFRKHAFIDPGYYDYYNYQTCRDQDFIESLPPYTSLKFRCVGGDYETYTVGGLCDVPLMRIEEMYYIEAEAKGLQNLSNGVAALNSFVQTYRQSDYSFSASDTAAFEDEILFQKRVEFWGEGIAFFDAKRMRAGTKQWYEGSNAPGNEFQLNCNGIKPNWNYVIPLSEINNNVALKGLNNPDPSDTVPQDLTEY